MTNNSLDFGVLFFACFTVLVLILGFWVGRLTVDCPDLSDDFYELETHLIKTCDRPIYIPSCPACVCNQSFNPIVEGCYNTFENVVFSMSEQKAYNVNSYNCVAFSNHLSERLNTIGWHANVEYGRVGDVNHAFVHVRDIYVEAITGTIIHPDEYKKYGIDE